MAQYLSYLDPNFWKNAMQGATGQGYAQNFMPVQQAQQPVNPNLVSLPAANPTAPRFQFDPSTLQGGIYNPNMRLNTFLQALSEAKQNQPMDAANFATPQANYTFAQQSKLPSLGGMLPPPPPAPAPAQTLLPRALLPMSAFSNVKDYAKYAKANGGTLGINFGNLFRR